MNRNFDSSVSSNNDGIEGDILSFRTHSAIQEKSGELVSNLFKRTGTKILEISKVNCHLEQVNIRVSKIDNGPLQELSMTTQNDYIKTLDKMLESIKAFD